MFEKEEKLPQINRSQTIGQRALRVFQFHCPAEWIINESLYDYGWDGIVEIVKESKVGEAFFLQMKGSDSPTYLEDKKNISLSLEVTTIRSLLSRPIPTMLSICDTGKKEPEPVYWVWLNESIKEIKKNNPNWENQKTISIYIPTSQEFTKHSAEEIEKYLSEFYVDIAISKEIIDVIKPSIGLQDAKLAGKSIDEAVQIAAPHLIDAGLIDIEKEEGIDLLKALSPDDQKLYREIKEVSILLKNYQDEKALSKLDDISKEIEFASKSIKARYFNNRGVLATHLYKDEEALVYYKKACELVPGNKKYETNSLNIEYASVIKKGFNEFTIVDDWKRRLEIIINKNPNYSPAIRLKTIWLGNICGFENAANFIKKSQVWNDDPIASRICLIELCIDLGEFDNAIDIYNDVKSLNLQLELPFWSICGYVLFMRALGKTSFHDECQFFGAGPSNINLDFLKQAEECYKKAFNELISTGLPKFSEQIIINYSSILDLLNKNERSDYINKAYLTKYPESYLINGALSTVISKQGNPAKALPYARKAFENDPNPSLSYKNYYLCLYLADEYDKLIKLINSRIARDFDDKKEEGLSRTLLAISFNEIGKPEKANEQIDYLKNNPDYYAFGIIAEGEIANKNGESRETVLNIYKQGLEVTSNDEKLITFYVQYLNPHDKKQAKDLISCCKTASKKRELMPYEYLSYGRAYLTLNKPEEAMQVYLRAHNHYPEMPQICYELALSIADIGDVESAYKILEHYFQASTFNYNLLVNMAALAMDTNRLDKAISLFQIALKKTKDQKITGDIHCQLYELKKRKKQPLKELLRHIHEFGQTIKDNLQREARYIMMMMLSPHISPNEQDEEINEWFKIASKRLEEFSKKYPNFPMLRTFKINTNIPEDQRGWDILTTLASVMLPFQLISSSLRIAVRGQTWPLEFRARHLGRCSLFEYWSRCVQSKETEHSIHICNFDTPLIEEHNNAQEAKEAGRICVDITALLTLVEFDLLNILLVFDEIIISRGTKQLLDAEFFGIREPHNFAKKIET